MSVIHFLILPQPKIPTSKLSPPSSNRTTRDTTFFVNIFSELHGSLHVSIHATSQNIYSETHQISHIFTVTVSQDSPADHSIQLQRIFFNVYSTWKWKFSSPCVLCNPEQVVIHPLCILFIDNMTG